MATQAEIDEIRRRQNPGYQGEGVNAGGPVASYSPPGLIIKPDIPAISRGTAAPPPALASSPGVDAAYQALMQYIANTDQDRGKFARRRDDSLAQAASSRLKSVMQANQGAADRGILNSGAALQQQGDVNQQWDQYDTGVRNQFTDWDAEVGRNITGLTTGYENAQNAASAKLTQDAADAAAAAQVQADEARREDEMRSMLMAILNPEMAAVAAAPAVPPVSYYNPAAQAANKPKVRVGTTTPSGTTGKLIQAPHAGPQ
jgi:hypothetical protein